MIIGCDSVSNLYDIVQKVINASDSYEADSILYGVDGISINSDEYYKNIISTFIQKKEAIIRKRDNKLIFDLNSYNDMWNIVFLGEYIKENDDLYKAYNQLLFEMKEIEDELELIKNSHKVVSTREEHLKINEEYKKLNDEFLLKKEDEKTYKSVVETFYEIDWIELENSNDELEKLEATKLLKQSISIIHKFRNSLAHGFDNEGKNFEINNENFAFSIPIEYLDGFNKGRIIANDDDKIVVEKTNTIISPIFEMLEYDIKKIESFFYNVNPDYLGFLLEQVNYDYIELYKLSPDIFTHEKQIKYFLENNIDFDYLKSNFNKNLCYNPKSTILFYSFGIPTKKMSLSAFKYPEAVLEFVDKGVDVTKLKNGAFEHPSVAIMLYKEGIDITKLDSFMFDYPLAIMKFNNNKIDVTKLNVGRGVFRNPEVAIMLYKEGIDITKLDGVAFEYPEAVMQLFNNKIDVTKINGRAFEHPEATMQLFNNKIDVTKINGLAFEHPEVVIELVKKGIDVTKLDAGAFKYPKAALQLYDAGIDITKLEGTEGFKYPKLVMKFFEKGINVTKLHSWIFKYPEAAIKLADNKIDITKMGPAALEYPEFVINLKSHGIEGTNVLIEEELKYQDIIHRAYFYDKDLMPNYSMFFSKLDMTNDFFEIIEKEGIDARKIPSKIYALAFALGSEKNYEIIESENNIEELINALLLKVLKNTKYLLKLTNDNYDKLEELPIEFFYSDLSLIDEMYKTYNSNVAKSIFGIDNPKIIASLIYCNSVFRKYQKENGDCELVNLDCMKVIHSSFNDTYMYRNNIEDVTVDQTSYLNQFVLDSDGTKRNYDGLKSNILDKLRNSIVHFRFKPVKDNKGNIVEDKVYLYDRYDNSTDNNFNIIIDVKDLVEIARQVELDLSKSYEDFEVIAKEENRFRTK